MGVESDDWCDSRVWDDLGGLINFAGMVKWGDTRMKSIKAVRVWSFVRRNAEHCPRGKTSCAFGHPAPLPLTRRMHLARLCFDNVVVLSDAAPTAYKKKTREETKYPIARRLED